MNIRTVLLILVFCLTSLFGRLLAATYADIVVDAETNEMLSEQHFEIRFHPACSTKLITLYVTFVAIRTGEISMDY